MNTSSGATSRHDGDLLFLTDSAYFALVDDESAHAWQSKEKNKQDGLFMERLESFIEGQQKDIEAFAVREQRSLDEASSPYKEIGCNTPFKVPILHGALSFRFKWRSATTATKYTYSHFVATSNFPSIRNTLARLSGVLQQLHTVAGLDSLLLVVSPAPPKTSGSSQLSESVSEFSWIGGTELGKDFWMGLKGGGLNGARAFRMKCQMRHDAELRMQDRNDLTIPNPLVSTSPGDLDPISARTTKVRSGDVKTELNAAVRQALRAASGNPTAEMRWTRPSSLEESCGVQLVGWPSTVNMRNPSNNSLKENRLLLDLVRSGKMKFVKRGSPEWVTTGSTGQHITLLPDKLNETQSPSLSEESRGIVSTGADPWSSPAPMLVHQPLQPLHLSPIDAVNSKTVFRQPLTPASARDTYDIPSPLPPPSQGTPKHGIDEFAVKAMEKRREVEPDGLTQDGRESKRAKLDSGNIVLKP
ncbi:hypothetical protein K439DRAFT_1621986 [Ramaria rubella]|nr:hypothetical protein K439DRAFT_1621986 [Ramaria rubella]